MKWKFWEAYPPPCPETIRLANHEQIQEALSAYFAMHAIPANRELPNGLVIPWAAVVEERQDVRHGFLISTGRRSEVKRLPLFKVLEYEVHNGCSSYTREFLVAMDPEGPDLR